MPITTDIITEDDAQYACVIKPGYDSREYVTMMRNLHERTVDLIVGEVLDDHFADGYLTIRLDSLRIALEEREKWQAVIDLYDSLSI